MTVTVGNLGSSPRAGKVPGGLQIRQCQITTSTGSTGADYTTGGTGFNLGLIKANLGFRTIFAVLSATVDNGANPAVQLADKVWWTYDHVNDRLRFWKGSSGASNMTEDGGTNIIGGSRIRLTILGV